MLEPLVERNPTDCEQLLVLDPEKRLNLDQILAHPWILKHCVRGEKATGRDKATSRERAS